MPMPKPKLSTLSLVPRSHDEAVCCLSVKQLLQEAKTSVQKLRDEGNGCFAKQDYDQALKKYKEAIEICEERDFERELSVLTSNMAAVYLKLNSFEDALMCSNKSLELNPEYFKVCTFFSCFFDQHACPDFASLL